MNKFNSYITAKSDVGTFSYDNAQKPYAVTGASAVGSSISANTQDITFYSSHRPRKLIVQCAVLIVARRGV